MDFGKYISKEMPGLAISVSEACRIKSTEEEPLEGMPFGKGPAEALEYFLLLGKKFGFDTENFQNYAGHIDFGKGDDMIGILAHVDVVPAGDNWLHDPWGGEISEGTVWGRGTCDDKGPAMVCLYAMKILKDSGVPLKKKIRLILGTNEETNWGCMDYYLNKVKPKMPVASFSPDAVFPVTYAEKGIYQFTLSKKVDTKAFAEGGSAVNAVPSSAEALLPHVKLKEAQDILPKLKTKCRFDFKEEGEFLKAVSHGKGGHAAELEGTVNAVSGLFELLSHLDLDESLNEVTAFYKKYISLETDGRSLGIDTADESGKLTFNASKINLKDGSISLSFDIRVPVTKKMEPVIKKIRETAEKEGFVYSEISAEPPLYIDKNSPLVKSLMESYQKVTGDCESKMLTAGGGTYSRCIPNCVAFGCILPNQKNTIHQAEEHLRLSDMEMWLKIYLEAIYDLAK